MLNPLLMAGYGVFTDRGLGLFPLVSAAAPVAIRASPLWTDDQGVVTVPGDPGTLENPRNRHDGGFLCLFGRHAQR
jgi:hypothetical protein